MPARKCRYKTTGLLIGLMLFSAVPGSGYMLQDKKVLAVEFEKQGNVPEIYMLRIKNIIERYDNVVWQPLIFWDTQKRYDQDQEYLEGEGISYVVEGKIEYSGENAQNRVDIVLLDSLQKNPENYSFEFKELSDMEESLRVEFEDILYFTKHKKRKRKVFIVKFRLGKEIESGDKDDVELEVPKSIEIKLLSDDRIKNAFYFDFTRKEFEEVMSEDDNTNILKGEFEPFAKIQSATNDTVYYYKINVEILFYQTQEDNIGISIPEIPKSANYKDRLAGAIIQRLKEMVSQQEVEL